MPIIKSAKKRVKVARKATIRNSKTKRSLRAAVKTFAKAVHGDGKKPAATAASNLSEAQSNLDKAVKKGVLHKNKAARLKHQLAVQAKAAGVAPAATDKAAKKTSAKAAAKPATATKAKAEKPEKPAAKAKATVAKPATKKAASKKPAAKK